MTENPKHWAQQQERGTAFFLKLTQWIVRYCPLWLIRFCTFWVVLYFYLTSRKVRHYIAEYQQNLTAYFPQVRLKKAAVFRQFLAFGEAITDRFAVWQHQIHYADLVIDDSENLYAEIDAGGRGQILICSHFGNIEICRALLNNGHHPNFKLNALVHSKHAEAFNHALVEAGADELPLIQVEELDAQKMLALSEKIEQGEWIAIAADRIPLRGDKTYAVNFLGKAAEFPEGAWLLAALLKAPINTIFSLKENGKYRLKLRHFSSGITGRAKVREQHIHHVMQQYADLLAKECAKNPHLWFNFYDFWQQK
ncbi:LpxL/LpxP family acyltransferase [Rodentibacter haemolyticus]|uniref:Glycosyl transferase family 2 n=1 Tax=Rodentibacter haemolyticus TaxID=2778911 RepID=A0ABX6UZE8_9PAST|nr:glycosyl transferase family 2 [Rodentibacter haemolyticus]QPB43510.1 glycosyl transferase family 2 [Rodentibacter haemolyticus]